MFGKVRNYKMRFTGDILVERDYLLFLRRSNVIDGSEYKKQLKKLEKKQERVDRKEAERVEAARQAALVAAAEAERKRKAAEKKAKREAKAEEKRKVGEFSFSESINVKNAKVFYDLIKKSVGKRVFVEAKIEKQIIENGVMKAKKINFSEKLQVSNASAAWENIYLSMRNALDADSGTPIFFSVNHVNVIKIDKRVTAKKMTQSFKHGATNCFMTPIVNLMESKLETYNTEASKKRMGFYIKKAKAYAEEFFETGVPEDKIEEICKDLNVSVYVYDVFGGNEIVYNKGKNLNISFMNTQANHVDFGKLVLNESPMEVSDAEMFEIMKGLCKRDEWFITQGKDVFTKNIIQKYKEAPSIVKLVDYPIPSLVRTLNGCFKLMDEKNKMLRDFDESIDKYGKAIDAVANPELAAFCQDGYVVNAVPVFFQDEEKAVGHLDLNKAYAQFKKCGYYRGFVGKVWRWSKLSCGREFVEKHLGMYQFVVRNVPAFFAKLGFRVGAKYVLPSPEVLCLMDMGIEMSIVAGAWGSRFDFDFDEKMVSSGMFRLWSGKLGMNNSKNVYSFKGDKAFASHIQAMCPDVEVTFRNGIITVYIDKKRHPVFFHIAGFITSYTRINILMKMKELGFDNIVKVMLDGIYTTCEVSACDMYKVEKLKHHGECGATWYSESSVDCSSWPEFDGISERLTCLNGAGGTGKTHSVLNGSYNDVLYVAPTRMLGFKMAKTTGCKFTTLHKFVGFDGDNKKVRTWADENGGHYPAVVLLDERTMCSKAMIERAVSLAPESMILLAGDMEGKQWFQCRNGDGETFMELYDADGWAVKNFVVDYRAKDEKLKAFKVAIRNQMRKCFTAGGREDVQAIENWVVANVDMVSFFDAVDMFSAGDMWIAPTNEISNRLLAMGVCSGYKVKHAGRGNDGAMYSRGEILDVDVGSICEKRGSITCHSSQGLTLKNNKIFISVYDSFDYAMIYTALSRAESWEQLVFVGK